ncbi:MAG: LL-diaminopimelate aminotransferase [Burkholderiales bacterium]
MEDALQKCIARRLGGADFGKDTELYKFAKIKSLKAAALRENPGVRLIDMGVGEPDKPADKEIVDVLAREAAKCENRFYADNGIAEFQQAAAAFLERMYGVKLEDPLKNVLHTIGSKSALAMLPICFIDPGDIALVTVPGYPVMGTYTRYLGGETYELPLLKQNDFYPDFSSIPDNILKRAKMLYINYPNNPTGKTATKEFYKRVVEFAQKNGIVVVSDAAYSAITFDGEKPLSFLSVDGAQYVGVEIHSLSKSFNMTGWRLGFVAGSEKIISALAAVKDNTDSGQFRAIQKAGAYALNNMGRIIEDNCKRYSRRFDKLVRVLESADIKAQKPKGTFYCYVEAPKSAADGTAFDSAEQCAEYLIKKALISTVPWDDAGAYLRMSVTFEAADEREEDAVLGEVEQRLKKLGFKY